MYVCQSAIKATQICLKKDTLLSSIDFILLQYYYIISYKVTQIQRNSYAS